MALTRKMLAAMDISAEKIDEIIANHTETVNALKEERDSYKDDAEKLKTTEKQLSELKKELANADTEGFEKKYNDLKKEYDDYRADVENKATRSAKEEAYKKVLASAGVSEKRIGTVMRVSDIDSIELNKDGSIRNVDKLTESIKEEWADFIVNERQQGANTPNHPGNGGGGGKAKSKEDIMKITDTVERQKAWAEYLESDGEDNE